MNQKEAQSKSETHSTLINRNYIIEGIKVKVIKVAPSNTNKEDVFDVMVTCEWLDPEDNNHKFKFYDIYYFINNAKLA